ncbi:hypothetical protein QR680_008531 [Steinernema hermaphroditum]|uniref:Uncharacterized protein n=1 Tax=Steinernema hermaphroditum TaxID=289476 RepID=A0AA39IGY9_9BILA|nr:hypothetical protein QR680_008531 [Steinernema hermaphroditum]
MSKKSPETVNPNPGIDLNFDRVFTEDGDTRRSNAACICMVFSAVIFVLSILTALGAAIAMALQIPWGEG